MSIDSVSLPVSGLQPPAFPGNRIGALLQSYFRSGWAFLIPYLAAYLLYASLKWPVNPVTGGLWSVVPCLLHVYWALHAIHLALGIIALRTWWKNFTLNLQLPSSTGALGASASGLRSPVSAAAYRLLPWACLALIFWIPGLYLEWPSDPWEHLRRINEWRMLDEVTAHSSWKKSNYLLPFSLTGHLIGTAQLNWLNVYASGASLLLGWQYYRLARAVGLGEHAALVFVLLNALALGNNAFSFYRYYALSSSIFAQLGAIALIRTVLEVVTSASTSRARIGAGEIDFAAASPLRFVSVASLSLVSFRFLGLSATGFAVLALIAYNHVQGLGIAGIGIGAVAIWCQIDWRRSMLGWLVAVALLLNIAALLWLPRHPNLGSVYDHGWLTGYYGFDVFSPSSPTWDRSLQILGVWGAISLPAAIWLIRGNHVSGWLTLAPILALASPLFALPYVNSLLGANQPVVVFHRVLFALPPWLALVVLGAKIPRRALNNMITRVGLLVPVLIGSMIMVPGNAPWFNRLFHLLAKHTTATPNLDSSMTATAGPASGYAQPGILALPVTDFRLRSFGANTERQAIRTVWLPPSADADSLRHSLMVVAEPRILFLENPWRGTAPFSTMGFLSGHWPSQPFSGGLLGQKELTELACSFGASERLLTEGKWLSIGRERQFLTPFHEICLELARGTAPSRFCPPLTAPAGAILEAIGTPILQSGRDAPAPIQSRESEFGPISAKLVWRMESPPAQAPRLELNEDFTLLLDSMRIRELVDESIPLAISQPAVVIYDPATPVLESVKIKSVKASGGLFIDLPLDPAKEYVVEIRGRAHGTAPSLRVESEQSAVHPMRYIPLNGAGVRLKIQGQRDVQLLIYQDSPFDYDLESLHVRLAKIDSPADNSVSNIFTPDTPSESFEIRP